MNPKTTEKPILQSFDMPVLGGRQLTAEVPPTDVPRVLRALQALADYMPLGEWTIRVTRTGAPSDFDIIPHPVKM